MRFYTSPRSGPSKDAPPQLWEVGKAPWERHWNEYQGHRAKARGGYYIIRCDEQIIRSHGDIWNHQALETYAGLLRMVTKLREPGRKQFRQELQMLKARPLR